jgi:flagellar biogenesis protein FliO
MTRCRLWVVTGLAAGVFFAGCLGALHAADTGAAPIPFKKEQASDDSDVRRMLIGMVVVVIAAAAGLYLVRRRDGAIAGPDQGARQVRVIEMQRLNPRATLYVVEFAGARYLLAYSEHGVRCVAAASGSAKPDAESVL